MKIFKLLLTLAIASWVTTVIKLQPAVSAEEISFYLSVFGEFKLDIRDLAIFAESGEITPEFAYYANRLDDKTRQQLRQILQTSFDVEPITVYRVTNMAIGEDFLKRLGNIIYTHPQGNGFYAIRSALIQAAEEPEGLTAINFLRHFPADEIQLNTEKIFAIVKEAQNFFQYKDTTIKAISQQAQREISSSSNPDRLPDPRQPGEYRVTKETPTFPINDLRQTATGFAGNYDLNVDIYTPEQSTSPAPLAIIAHGLGSSRTDFDYLAEHLASHGYIVAVPEHAGSSNSYQQAFLRGEYAEQISSPELPLHLIQSLTPEQLTAAYGDTPPTSPIPEPVVASEPTQTRDILAEIEQTGKLKVAIRTNAAPFGYLDENNNLDGYCVDLATALGDRLTQELNTSNPIEVVKILSSLSTRFELVEEKTAHLECGPNSIVSDKKMVVFSDPFFSSGTRFLASQDNISNIDLDTQLEGIRLGVLKDTTTKEFLLQNYPNAEIITFDSSDGRNKGIRAVEEGNIDAMVSDRVLLTGEIDRQGLNRDNFQTIPEQPLTCDYYGLILPKGDPQWRNTVNVFICDRPAKKVFDRWLGDYYSKAIADLDYCQNQREQ